MNQAYAFTYVIGYRHRMDRLQNLKRVLEWINGFNGVEVLLIEQDTHSKIENLNLRAKHIFVKSDMPYNRSWAFNIAIKYSTAPLIVFGDSDLIMNPNDFINGLKALQEYEMVSPYHTVVDLEQQESNMDFNQILQISRPGRGETDNQKINISGGIAMFRKESIMKIGGWNEDFIGWGGEDDFQTIKVHKFLKWTELRARCYHLYHAKEQPDMKWYQRNLQILNNSAKMTNDELSRHIAMSSQKIGMINKYDK